MEIALPVESTRGSTTMLYMVLKKSDAEYHSDDHSVETILESVTGEHEKDKSIIRGKEMWSGTGYVNSGDI